MGKLGHTGCWEGKRVIVFLKNGKIIEDRFEGRNKKQIFLKEHGKIPKSEIRHFSIGRLKEIERA